MDPPLLQRVRPRLMAISQSQKRSDLGKQRRQGQVAGVKVLQMGLVGVNNISDKIITIYGHGHFSYYWQFYDLDKLNFIF